MSQSIISVENLSKSYLVGHNTAKSERYTALRDVLSRNLKSLGRKTWDMFSGKQIVQGDEVEEFWALKDVSFDVNRGEVVGIIGRNGAGKSTLLKVLSRITEPTRGKVTLRGRVASLLEVGTGFHPELTGRENIFLNGAILGMNQSEIKSKFDAIVAFAEVERFLDTPVKRYSSGMYVRLAFAVAAHLEPEILIVDEVLAVGDAEFQRKCLGKMKNVADGGRTVLFVSHNLEAVREMCTKSIQIDRGSIASIGRTDDVIAHYNMRTQQASEIKSRYVESVFVSECNGKRGVEFGGEAVINVMVKGFQHRAYGLNVSIVREGRRIFLVSTQPHDGVELPSNGRVLVQLSIHPCFLAPGDYYVDVSVTDPGLSIIEHLQSCTGLTVLPKSIGGTWPYTAEYGDFFPSHAWSVQAG